MASYVDPSLDIPNQSSDFASWIQWHKDLKSYFGLQTANTLFLLAWQKRQPTGFFAGLDITNKKTFRDYFASQGIKLDENAADLATDFTYGVFDKISGALNLGKNITIGILIFGGVLVVWILYQIFKNPAQYTGAATAVATRGMIR